MITLFEKAAAIAIKLELITDRRVVVRPEYVLRMATSEEIDFYYNKIIESEAEYEVLVPGMSALR